MLQDARQGPKDVVVRVREERKRKPCEDKPAMQVIRGDLVLRAPEGGKEGEPARGS